MNFLRVPGVRRLSDGSIKHPEKRPCRLNCQPKLLFQFMLSPGHGDSGIRPAAHRIETGMILQDEAFRHKYAPFLHKTAIDPGNDDIDRTGDWLLDVWVGWFGGQ